VDTEDPVFTYEPLEDGRVYPPSEDGLEYDGDTDAKLLELGRVYPPIEPIPEEECVEEK
jgi:hypothetical protein